MRFPILQQNLQLILTNEMDKICHEETFLKEEPERLDIALKRCKKLTGTLVTLKRWVNEIEIQSYIQLSMKTRVFCYCNTIFKLPSPTSHEK